MTDYVIETTDLCRDFARRRTITDMNLRVPRGTVYGLLGVNGSGKTTTIKLLMGHLRPTKGTVTVLGRSYKTDLVEIRKRIGYVSENRYLYDWMTVDETLRFAAAFHENWDWAKAGAMMERLELDPTMKVKHLSRGNRARLCLIVALAFNPELLILDEPTSGLDPIVRRDFIENVIMEIEREGRTVLFSSHLVEEIERVADWVGIIHNGRLKVGAPMDQVKASVKKVRFALNGQESDFSGIDGLLKVESLARERILTIKDLTSETLAQLRGCSLSEPEIIPLSLEDVFVESVRSRAL
ncbi:MAG: ABC transporter ATP-binding protein [Acidobacteria bacterium]|nr:ABC transporter ATP-binding protein [Acidobacteriota bacterium]